ncbi:LOW QUALITY PROTEIN: homeobox protein NANOG-like [Octodon degus]|uniref:LOW QUALITY PROTEIN: homeobox protein NANOG-like n=1 Tax=Octodon degus TaxID=10160 RepID=A0A6P6F3I3_OCTDE|nr:LOW QUALITY PROTEIN: homeobox protein NANOG-like [Octodon degus]
MLKVPRPAETYNSLQTPEADVPLCEAAASFLPSSGDRLIQQTPDSSTSPCVPLPGFVEASGKQKVKKQKVRTSLHTAQLCVLNDRFQRQKYLSLQQMQELRSTQNLSYKQVKTWFQNQRRKCKRWQKSNWQNSADTFQKGTGTCSKYAQGSLVTTSGNLPMWGNQIWNNTAWNS